MLLCNEGFVRSVVKVRDNIMIALSVSVVHTTRQIQTNSLMKQTDGRVPQQQIQRSLYACAIAKMYLVSNIIIPEAYIVMHVDKSWFKIGLLVHRLT